MIRQSTIALAALVAVSGSALAQPRVIEIPAQPSAVPRPADKAMPPERRIDDPQRRSDDPRWAEAVANAREKLLHVEKASAALSAARADYEKVKAQQANGAATNNDLNAAASRYVEAETELRRAVLESAQAEAVLMSLAPPRGAAVPSIDVIRPQPQAKLPARNGFPNAQSDFALAQLESDVWNLRLEGAKLELAQLEATGADKTTIEAAKARVNAAQAASAAADAKVLKTSKILYGW